MSLTGYFDCFDRRVPVRYIEELDLEAIADYATYEGSNYDDSDALHEAFEAALTYLYEWFPESDELRIMEGTSCRSLLTSINT